MLKIGWIVLIVLALAILAQSETTTTRKPRARKASLSKSLSSSNSSLSSDTKKVQQPSDAKKVLPSSSKIVNQPSQRSHNVSYAVRRNPASIQRSAEEIKPIPNVNPSRLKEDMTELGLNVPVDSNDNSNVLNVLETPRSPSRSRPRPRPRPRPSASRPRSPPQERFPQERFPQEMFPLSRGDPFDPFADYEDLLFDEYDEPLQDNKLLAESLPTHGKFLSSEV